MLFYLTVTALFWCRSTRVRNLLLSLLLGSLAALPFVVTIHSPVLLFYASLDLLAFTFGAWLATPAARKRLEAASTLLRALLTVLAIATLGLFYATGSTVLPHAGTDLLRVACGVTLVAAVLCWENKTQFGRPAIWLGDISYSLYLAHMFVVGAGWAIARELDIVPLSPGGVMTDVLIVAASLAAAHLSYRFLERPLMRVGKLRPPRIRTQASATW